MRIFAQPQVEAWALLRHSGAAASLRLLIVSARPWEWSKNAFLFAALLFAKRLTDRESVESVALAFGLYCLATTGVYLINDVIDRDEDREHPRKRSRPAASGALPVGTAVAAAALLMLAAVAGAFALRAPFGVVVSAYVLLMLAYSKWLKHVVIVDVFAIATGFVLRVVGGAVVIDVTMSHWLLICTLLLALFLGFSKRRGELLALAEGASRHRRVLTDYSPPFLDMMIGIVTSATVVAYTLYTVSEETIEKFHTDKLLLTLPFVLYGIFRYLYLVYRHDRGDNPARALFRDAPLLASVVAWGVVSALIVYVAGR
ncbi:MAG: decaprenyl-phosphate phosphoribosyltransferase [Alphaproteobacteria bacterium]